MISNFLTKKSHPVHLILILASLSLINSNSSYSQTVRINEVMSFNSSINSPISDQSFDWVELYNSSSNVIDLDGYFLSDDIEEPSKWEFPNGAQILPNSYKIIWLGGENAASNNFDELVANFKISSNGESVFLNDNDLNLIDESPPIAIQNDLTIGRLLGNSDWYYLNTPSPNAQNPAASAFLEEAQLPTTSHSSGLYSAGFILALTLDNDFDIVRYTDDFSEPDESSSIFTENFNIFENSTIKLKVFRENTLPSETKTFSFLFPDDLDLDIISVTSPQSNLFGSGGIYDDYFLGDEKEVSVHFFEDGNLAFDQNMGVKIHAPDGRDQLGLRLYARPEYGAGRVEHELFDEKNLSSFKRLVLRNGGNDGAELEETHFRDALGHQLYLESNPSNGMACYRPVNVFLNNEYWGIYNLRERQDEYYLQDNYGISPENVDFLEYDYQEPSFMKTISGDWQNWEELKAFVLDNDLSQEDNYEIIENWVDFENFIDYQAFQIIIGNQDWCNNNTKFWRPINGGKWQWIMWDVEYGFGTFGSALVGQPEFNFFVMAINWGGWGNGDYTWLFRKLLENEDFRARFITRTQDLLNTSFLPSHIEEKMMEMRNRIEPDMPHQLEKWGGSFEEWEESIDEFLFYTDQRPYHVLDNISTWYEFDGTTLEIDIDISDEEAGEIILNTLVLNDETIGANESTFPWNGIYYSVQELELQAVEYPGYEFSHWDGDFYSEESSISLFLNDDIFIEAIYNYVGEETTIDYTGLVINEIQSNNNSTYTDELGEFEDWIELYNSSTETINLSGLFLSDKADNLLKFQIPISIPDMLLAPNQHVIFYADDDQPQGNFHTNFKLSGSGEDVFLSYLNTNDEAIILDQINFGPLSSDTSLGRSSDASEEWISFEIPTPNAPNEILINIDQTVDEEIQLMVYPNPASDYVSVLNAGQIQSFKELNIVSLQGKTCLTVNRADNLDYIDISSLSKGAYFIELLSLDKETKRVFKFIKS